MSERKVYVAFSTNNARVFVNPDPMTEMKLLCLPDTLLNPDMEEVKCLSPQYWKNVKGKLKPMNHFERILRSESIVSFGADNDVFKGSTLPMKQRIKLGFHLVMRPFFYLTTGAVIALLIRFVFNKDL